MASPSKTRCIQAFMLRLYGEKQSPGELAERLGVNERTIFRYLQQAEEAAAGLGLSLDELAGGNGNGHECQTGLSDREAVAVALAVQTSPMIRMANHRAMVDAGLAKLLAGISDDMRRRVAVLAEEYRSAPQNGSADSDERAVHAAVVAIADRLARRQ